MSFRGQWEISGQITSGTFLSITELMAKYDTVVKELYKDDVTLAFPMQLLSFSGCLRESISVVKTTQELTNMLIVVLVADNNTASFGEVCTFSCFS